jgi:hypothetical protein
VLALDSIASASGYGVASWREGEQTKGRPAHRLAYELLVGPIPEDHELHHLCGFRSCVKPEHLVPLTASEHRWVHESHKDPKALIETLRASGLVLPKVAS